MVVHTKSLSVANCSCRAQTGHVSAPMTVWALQLIGWKCVELNAKILICGFIIKTLGM